MAVHTARLGPLLLASLCIIHVLADDSCPQISEIPACGINPEEDNCSVPPSLSRVARSTYQNSHDSHHSAKSFHHIAHSRPSRSARPQYTPQNLQSPGSGASRPFQNAARPRSTRSTRNQIYEDTENDDGFQDFNPDLIRSRRHVGYSRNARSVGTQGSEESEEDNVPYHYHHRPHFSSENEQFASQTDHLNKEIPPSQYFANARYCPHCKQLLPPDMHHHEPMDPRIFRQYQQNPHILDHQLSQTHSSEGYVNEDANSDATSYYNDEESPDFSDMDETNFQPPVGFNQSSPVMMSPNPGIHQAFPVKVPSMPPPVPDIPQSHPVSAMTAGPPMMPVDDSTNRMDSMRST